MRKNISRFIRKHQCRRLIKKLRASLDAFSEMLGRKISDAVDLLRLQKDLNEFNRNLRAGMGKLVSLDEKMAFFYKPINSPQNDMTPFFNEGHNIIKNQIFYSHSKAIELIQKLERESHDNR